MSLRHSRALAVLAAAVTSDIAFGVWFAAADHVSCWNGLYFAVTTATTVGYGDILPHGWAAHVCAVLIMVTVIPLFGAVFSLMTSGMTADHVRKARDEMKLHLEEQLRRRLGGGKGQ